MRYLFLILNNLLRLFPLYLIRFINMIKVFISFKHIKNKLKNKNKTIYMVYDFETTNPTFGEYLWFLLIARYFLLKNKKVELIVIDDLTKNCSFNILTKNEIVNFKKELQKLTLFFLKKNFTEYSNFNKFKLDFNNKKEKILFSFLVFNKLKIYDFLFKLINLLLSKENDKFLNKIKFTRKNIKLTKKLNKIKPYICWNIRKNTKWGNYNNTKNELIQIANYLGVQKKIIIS